MLASPFSRMTIDFYGDELNENSCQTFDLARFDRSLHVLDKLKYRSFLEKTRSLSDQEVKNDKIRRTKSSPGSSTNELSNKRKIYPVRFKFNK